MTISFLLNRIALSSKDFYSPSYHCFCIEPLHLAPRFLGDIIPQVNYSDLRDLRTVSQSAVSARRGPSSLSRVRYGTDARCLRVIYAVVSTMSVYRLHRKAPSS